MREDYYTISIKKDKVTAHYDSKKDYVDIDGRLGDERGYSFRFPYEDAKSLFVALNELVKDKEGI